jgi:TetR/AcrR family transcriptional repressor of nem operon
VVRDACRAIFAGWADSLAQHLEAARMAYTPDAPFDPVDLATHFIAVVEGALILAKTSAEPDAIDRQLDHFRAYVRCLFGRQAHHIRGFGA